MPLQVQNLEVNDEAPQIDFDSLAEQEALENNRPTGRLTNRSAEEASFAAGVNPDIYDQVLAEEDQLGESPTAQQLSGMVQETNVNSLKQGFAGKVLDPAFDISSLGNELDSVQEQIAGVREADINSNATLRLIEASDPKSAEERNSANISKEVVFGDILARYNRDRERAKEEIRDLVNTRVGKLDPSVGKSFFEFVISGIAPGFGFRIAQIVKEVDPESHSTWNYLFPGEAYDAFKTTYLNSSPEKQLVMIKKLIEQVKEWAPNLIGNSITEADVLQLLADIQPESADDDLVRALYDVFGVLDVIPLGGTITRAGRSVVRGIREGSVAKRIQQNGAAISERLLRQAMEDATNRLAKALGTTREQIALETMLPKAMDDKISIGTDLSPRAAELERILNRDITSSLLRPEEREAQIGALQAKLDAPVDTEPHVRMGSTKVEVADGKMRAHFVIGADNNVGFSDPRIAGAVAETYRDSFGQTINYRILQRDPKTNNIVEYVPPKGPDISPPGLDTKPNMYDRLRDFQNPKGEFFIEARVDESFSDVEGLIGGIKKSDIVGKGGRRAKYFSIATQFGDWMRTAMNVAVDRQSVLEKAFGDLNFKVNNLNVSQRTKIMEVLDAEDAAGESFKDIEILKRLEGDQQAFDAHKAMRESFEVWRLALNRQLRNKLDKQGFKSVTVTSVRKLKKDEDPTKVDKDVVFTTMARPIAKGEARAAKAAQDPDTGAIIKLSPSSIKKLYEEGGSLLRTGTKVKSSNGVTNYIIHRPASGRVVIENLPKDVVRKIDGWVPRMYQSGYKVVVRKKGLVDLEEVEYDNTVAILSNQGDALAEADRRRMIEKDPKVEYHVVDTVETTNLRYDNQFERQSDLDYLESSGRLFYSRRGPELKPLIETVSGGRTLRGVVDSINASRASVARSLSMEPLVDNLMARMNKTYGKEFGVDGKIPLRGTIRHNSNKSDPETLRRLKEVTALRDRIAILVGADEGTIRKAWSRFMVGVSERVSSPYEGSYRNVWSDRLLRAAKMDPTSFPKTIAFLKFILLAPVRQMVLQAQQQSIYAGIEGGLTYTLRGGFVRDAATLSGGLMARDTALWDTFKKTAAKGRGVSEDEIEDFIDGFRQSGLIQGVDSHDYTAIWSSDPRDVRARQSSFGKAMSAIDNSWKNSLRLVRRIGFDAGEITQLMAAFLHARNRWMIRNPKGKWNDSEALAQITSDARELSLNMNRADTAAYQRGGLGVIFQFMSHTFKSFQMILPTQMNMGNKWFTNKEKARILLLQTPLYGAGGFGLTNLWEATVAESGIEVPEEANAIVAEGMIGMAVNLAFQAADDEGENSRVDFSGSFAPLSGTAGNVLPFIELGAKAARGLGLDVMPFIPDAGTFAVDSGNPLTRMVEMIALSPVGIMEIVTGSPAGAAGSEFFDRLSQSAFIFGEGLRGELPKDESAFMLASNEMLRYIPAYNSTFQAIAAANTGEFVDRHFNPTVAASFGETLAKGLIGLTPTRERQQRQLLFQYNGLRLKGAEGIRDGLSDAASTLYDRHMRLLKQVQDGEWTIDQFYDSVKSEMQALRDGTTPEQWMYMMNAHRTMMLADLDADGYTPKLIKLMDSALHSGAINPGSSTVTRIKNMAPFEGQEELIQLIERTFNLRREDFNAGS